MDRDQPDSTPAGVTALELSRIHQVLKEDRTERREFRQEVHERFGKVEAQMKATEEVARENQRRLTYWAGALKVVQWLWAGIAAMALTFYQTIWEAISRE